MAKTSYATRDELIFAIGQLTEHVRLLGNIIDDLTSELQWHNRNASSAAPPPFALTTLPLDPADRDWQVNRYTVDEIAATPTPSNESRPRTLFD